ncbi:MAG TPA: NADP-dependent oxidoreductase [Chthonomonas sp.]|uniref:NADP-dependent oxidoreductase n=1 Tax=Chthonomonas sp. TaxID=2282153 RepID=UPI002B4AC11A|nr:NADP-dependent oxidoreductase [Chthonomonas sp.]HLI49414.1 NADP-dependent oxidoreductase [Chthonomonas sp.]
MKAIVVPTFTNPPTLRYEEVPKPQIAADEVLVRVQATSVNPVDTYICTGAAQSWLNLKLPLIPGADFAGVVEAVGSDVKDVKPGEEVYSYSPLQRLGAFAEYLAVPAAIVAPKPPNLSFEEAASLPIVALTAWQSLFEAAQLKAGQKVLIHAAAGGVGTMAVQLAKAHGAYVYGTASTGNIPFLKELGVDAPIDYTSTPFEQVAKEVDVVFDMVGGETLMRSLQTLKPGGCLVSIVGGSANPDVAKEAEKRGVRYVYVLVRPDRAQLQHLNELIAAGKLRPIIAKRYALEQAGEALAQVATRHTRGKVVMHVP